MKLRPLNDRVVIEQLEAVETTSGGIVLPDSAKEKPQQGEVVAVGEGSLNDDGSRSDMCVEVGDRGFFGTYAGTDVQFEGREFKIMREQDILAKVR